MRGPPGEAFGGVAQVAVQREQEGKVARGRRTPSDIVVVEGRGRGVREFCPHRFHQLRIGDEGAALGPVAVALEIELREAALRLEQGLAGIDEDEVGRAQTRDELVGARGPARRTRIGGSFSG